MKVYSEVTRSIRVTHHFVFDVTSVVAAVSTTTTTITTTAQSYLLFLEIIVDGGEADTKVSKFATLETRLDTREG